MADRKKRGGTPTKKKEEEIVFEIEETVKQMSRPEQVKRNLEIVSKRLQGVDEHEVAAEFGIGARRVRQIVAAYRATRPALREHDPMQIVDDLIDGYMSDISTLARVQSTAEGRNNFNAVIGAVNSKTTIRARLVELMQAVDVLPHELGTLKLVMDGRVLSERLMSWAAKQNLDLAAMEDLLEELGGPIEDAEVVEDDEHPALTA